MPDTLTPDPDTVLRLSRDIKAPRARVWEAWMDPAALAEWFVPAGCVMPECAFDVREGGAYDCLYVGEESGKHFPMAGEYVEISPMDRIVMTHGWKDDSGQVTSSTEMTITFADFEGGTRLELVQTGLPDAASRDSHGEGWSRVLDKLQSRSE